MGCLVDAVLVSSASALRAEEHDTGIIRIGSTEPYFKASACPATVAGAPQCLCSQHNHPSALATIDRNRNVTLNYSSLRMRWQQHHDSCLFGHECKVEINR